MVITTISGTLTLLASTSEPARDRALLWTAGSLAQQADITATLQTNEAVQQVYQELELQQILASEAIRRGIGERISVRQDIENARRAVLISALSEEIRAEAPEPE
jgi:hypothetical protein